jgi:hypothetical protein
MQPTKQKTSASVEAGHREAGCRRASQAQPVQVQVQVQVCLDGWPGPGRTGAKAPPSQALHGNRDAILISFPVMSFD